ncbi:MAG: lysylphosphatidylglycerol synthase transmembrane domain-containing protein [Anaerolineae bacterium]
MIGLRPEDMVRSWRFWLGIAVSAFFLYIALRGQKLDEVLVALRNADYWWLVPGIAVYFLAVVARTWRWHYMLRPMKSIPVPRLFPMVVIGYMGNNIYPARAGEILRSYVLRRSDGVPMSGSLATVLIERLFDGLTMLVFVFLTLPFFNVSDTMRRFVILFTILFLIGLVLFLYLASAPHRAMWLYTLVVERFVPNRFRGAVSDSLDRFMGGLSSLRSGRDVAIIFGTSIVIWLLETLKYWFVMHAFPFSVSFFVLMLMNGIVNLFTTIPAAPGYVGTFDAPGIEILKNAGVDPEVATAYTLVLHAALWLPITLLGIFFMWRAHLSWQGVQEELAQESESPLAAQSTSSGG